MNLLRTLSIAAVLGVTLAATQPARAGRSCEPAPSSPAIVQRGLQLAQRTHEALEAAYQHQGTRVVLLARAGQDLSRYNVHYSHLGFAYRTQTAQGQPAWRVLHKLNHCGTAESALYRQGLAEFFLDDLWRHEAAWVVPAPEVQARLMALLQDQHRVAALHEKRYSIVSYAWGRRYQQSNQWAIETLASAMDPAARDRASAQGWLQAQGYQPTVLRLGPLTRLGGRLTALNVSFDDHPDAKRFTDRIETVTVDSVFEWLQRSGLGGPTIAFR